MKSVINKFKSGGLHVEACSGNLECWEPSERLLIDTGKPRETCVEVAGLRTFRILTSSQQKLVTNKFKSGGLREKHVVATWNVGNRLSVCL
jgi:hypothetical protein